MTFNFYRETKNKEEQPVFLLIRHKSERKKFFVNRLCDFDGWDSAKKRYNRKHNNYARNNRYLNEVEDFANDYHNEDKQRTVLDIYTALKSHFFDKKDDVLTDTKDFVNDELNRLFLSLSKDESTKENLLISLQSAIKKELNKFDDFTISKAIEQFIVKQEKESGKRDSNARGIRKLLKSICDPDSIKVAEIDENMFNKMMNDAQEFPYENTTLNNYFSRLKYVIKCAGKNGATVCDLSDIQFLKEGKDMCYLTKEEIDKINNSSSKQGVERAIYQMLIFRCYTGMRIGDYLRIKEHNIIYQSENSVLSYTQEKTNKKVLCLLHEHVLKILDDNFFENKELIAKYENKKINVLMRDFLTKIGIDSDFEKQEYKYKKKTTTIVRKCDVITTHACRHSFAVMSLSKGMSIYDVRDLLGHSSVTMTERYLKFVPKDLLDRQKKAFEKDRKS